MPVIGFKVHGDYGKLDRWIKRFGALPSPAAALEVSRKLAKITLEQIDKGFENEQDPFGTPWAPKKEPDGRKILRGKTGDLRKFKLVWANSEGFKVGSRATYAGVHQNGSGTYGSRGRYPITARNAKMLRFKQGGATRYARQVMHPGVRQRRMEPGNRLPALWASLYREAYSESLRNLLR